MTAAAPASRPARRPVRTGGSPPGSLRRLYAVFLRHQLTWGRAAVIVVLGGLAILVGLAVRAGADGPGDGGDPVRQRLRPSLLVPICALVFASSSLGDPVDDGTLVYLWLRPVPRSRIAVAAATAPLTVPWPLVVVPLVLAAAATGGGAALVGGTAVACVVGTIGYMGLFAALGLR